MSAERVLSHSSISTYEECPRKFQQKYILRLPSKSKYFFSFGQSMHSAVEYFYSGETAPSWKELLVAYDKGWIRTGYRDVTHEQDHYEEGKQILNKFLDKHTATYKRPLRVEMMFRCKIGGVLMTGKIDRVDARRDGLLVLDYKTGKALDPERVLTDEQLTLYQVAIEQELKQKVDALALYHLPSLTVIGARRRNPKVVKALITKIKKVAKLIAAEEFPAQPEETRCRWCDYRISCPTQRAGTENQF
jgi:RecB family exonuclease